jgi:hypothetical protein
MRFFEFAGDDGTLEKFVTVLKNFVGRAASKKEPVKLNWAGLDRISRGTGMEITADYETFKAMYDTSPLLQSVVKNFNADGIELNVPGAPDAEKPASQSAGKTSQDAVDQTAASAAPQQLAAQA